MSLKLGLCIPKGKKTRIGFPDRIKGLCEQANIEIIEVDINGNLEKQGPFHVLLHKVLDYHNETEMKEANQKINKLINYSRKHKEMIVIDNFNWCFKLTNRKSMISLIKSCEFILNGIKVFLPKTIEITESLTTQEMHNLIKKFGIKFPIVSKSYSAYFDDGAHDMSLIFTIDALNKLRRPCLVQEFCNHGGVLYKVFVIGEQFKICERPSIKNLDDTLSTHTIHFDSFRVSKTGKPYIKNLHAANPNKRHWHNCDEIPNMLDSAVIQGIISRIHDKTGLYLYGFDVLLEKESGNYAVIDINQFPSYAGIGQGHFPRSIVSLIQSVTETF